MRDPPPDIALITPARKPPTKTRITSTADITDHAIGGRLNVSGPSCDTWGASGSRRRVVSNRQVVATDEEERCAEVWLR
jgi:hypothetical protein